MHDLAQACRLFHKECREVEGVGFLPSLMCREQCEKQYSMWYTFLLASRSLLICLTWHSLPVSLFPLVCHDRDIHDRDIHEDIHSRFLWLRCKRESCVADIARDDKAKLHFDAQMAELAQLAIVGNIYLGQGTSMIHIHNVFWMDLDKASQLIDHLSLSLWDRFCRHLISPMTASLTLSRLFHNWHRPSDLPTSEPWSPFTFLPCDASVNPEGRPVAETANAFFFGSWIPPNTNYYYHFNFPRNMSTQWLFPETTSAHLHTDGLEYQVPCFIPGNLLSFRMMFRSLLSSSPVQSCSPYFCFRGRIRARLARNRMSRAIFTFHSQRLLHAPLS